MVMTTTSVATADVVRYLDEALEAARFKDYCPNGLQVEGRPRIGKVVAGVTACQALLDAAVARGADAVLVHHGYFWRGENPALVGIRQRRIKTLLDHGINLLAYHLPLDAHPELGNNAQLARRLGLVAEGRFGEQDIGWIGRPDVELTLSGLAGRAAQALDRLPLVVGEDKPLRRIAWCTGGAQGYLEAAIAAGADAYISGEISEPTVHLARESGVAYLACGHHATERYGVQALAARLAERFGLEWEFVDIDNPV